MPTPTGILTSQIGYDTELPGRAIIRGPAGMLSKNASFVMHDLGRDGLLTMAGQVRFWGELWGSHWWIADFSPMNLVGGYKLRRRGRYALDIKDAGEIKFRSDPFEIGDDLLWRKTWFYASIDQAERRQRLAREKVGWYDAGAEWQEANSHASLLVGLCDLLEFAHSRIPADLLPRLEAQVENGCDYLARLQDLADALPNGKGAVVHQIWKFDKLILPADVSKAALAWARAGRTLSDERNTKIADYLERAEWAMRWLETAKPLGGKGFSYINHGVPEGTAIPDEWMTRDLLIELWAAFELTQAGRTEFQSRCVTLAEKILARQVPQTSPQGDYYGHFRTFDSAAFTEKAWVHHGDGGYGADCGGTFPNYVLPLLRMCETWPDHPQAARWETALRDFAYGYLLPACRANPFLLLPLGYVEGEGLLGFAGLWHGMNAAYGLTAALALEFARFFDDADFREIAMGNLQWIAGLNAGLTAESQFAAHMFSMDVPEGIALPVSMMQGIGHRCAGNWMQIRGSICNGFSVGDQFRFDVQPTRANDGPHSFTDEDWISHAGGWLSALSRL